MTTVDRSRLGKANNAKGKRAERDVVNWLRDHGFPGAERAVRTGYTANGRSAADPGDVTGTPGIVWQVKDVAREDIERWLAETEAQRLGGPGAKPAELGILVVRRRGTADVGRWWAWLPIDQLSHVMADETADQWLDPRTFPVRLELGDLVTLLRDAGYGIPPTVHTRQEHATS